MRVFVILFFILHSVFAGAQCGNLVVTPAVGTVNCTNGASPVTFTVSCTNTMATSAIHEWYSPYHPFPSGQPVFTSTGLSSVLSGSYAPGVYKVRTTVLPMMCMDSTTFTIVSPMAFPTFTAINSTHTLGCAAPLLQSTLVISGAVSNQTPVPSSLSYTFLPPSFVGFVNPTITLSPSTATLANTPGTWTIIVRDDGNMCRNILPVPVYQNTTQPNMSVSLPNSTLTCSNPTLVGLITSTTPGASVTWITPVGGNITSNTVVIGPPTGPPTSTASLSYANYTASVKDNSNLCTNSSLVIVNQDFKPPVSMVSISGSVTSINCSSPDSVILAQSGTVTSAAPNASLVNICWGIVPSSTISCGTGIFHATASAVYFSSVQDSYNGCKATQTINIPSSGQLNATMAHTVGGGGQVNFINTTAPTNSNSIIMWDFGDGFGASGNSLSHTYASAGMYVVSLKVSNGGVCRDTIQQAINVTGAPCNANANFSIVPTNTPQYWSIVPAYPWNVTNAVWNWGDGNTSNGLYSTHNYNVPGTYNICLSVTVSCGATASACVTYSLLTPGNVQVVEPPTQVIGIEEIENSVSSLSIYPNPGDGVFYYNVRTRDPEPVTFYVYNSNGQLIYADTKQNYSGELSGGIDLGYTSQGIYFLQIRTSNQVFNKKLVIAR